MKPLHKDAQTEQANQVLDTEGGNMPDVDRANPETARDAAEILDPGHRPEVIEGAKVPVIGQKPTDLKADDELSDEDDSLVSEAG